MAFTLNDVASWGRNLEEYCAMFGLSDADRQLSILGCGDGPASFNVEGTARGMRIVSVDPLYQFRAAEIRERMDAAAVEGAARRAAMNQFIEDYDLGISQGRYVTGSATELPFHDSSFDLALCSHVLFLDSQQHSLALHLQALRELTRVAEEVRVFPLLEMAGVESRHLRAVMLALQRMGLNTEKVPVPCEFQHGGNQMLRIRRA